MRSLVEVKSNSGLRRTCRRRELGIGRITLLVFGALIAAAVYGGFRIIPYYYYYFELENQMQSLIRVASLTPDQEIRKKLAQQLKRMDISATIDNLRIERVNPRMRMSLPYEEELWFSFRGKDYHIYTFKFNAYAEGDIGDLKSKW